MQKYCVYNQTRETFLSLGVTAAEPTAEHEHALTEKLPVLAGTGIWLKPYANISLTDGLAPFDLLYLDKDDRVIHQVESFPASAGQSLDREIASALAMPPHTIYSSQTQMGDQLVICFAEEMGRIFKPFTRDTEASTAIGVKPATSSSKSFSVDASNPPTSVNRSRQMQIALERLDERERDEEQIEGGKVSVLGRFMRWLSSDRRRGKRHPLPGLVAYYWTGGAPQAFHIGNISTNGLFLLTEERWFPGTLIQMTLQRVDTSGEEPGDSIPVQSKVVRWADDGVGLSFLHARSADSKRGDGQYDYGADKKSLENFIEDLNLSGSENRRSSKR